MFVSHKALNGWHLATNFYRQGKEREWRQLAEKEAQEGTATDITSYGMTLSPVTSFKYLGRVLYASDNDWP